MYERVFTFFSILVGGSFWTVLGGFLGSMHVRECISTCTCMHMYVRGHCCVFMCVCVYLYVRVNGTCTCGSKHVCNLSVSFVFVGCLRASVYTCKCAGECMYVYVYAIYLYPLCFCLYRISRRVLNLHPPFRVGQRVHPRLYIHIG